MTMTAENTSRIASIAASCALFPYSRMCRSTFSITTIASSTTMPVARTMPKSVSVLIEKPNSFTNANVPIERDGNRDRRNERAPPVLQEQEHHEHDEADGLRQRLQHLDDRLRTTTTLSKAICASSPGGKFFRRRSSSRWMPVNT